MVHVSGAHRQEHYGSGHWLLAADEPDLVRRFTSDVQDGLPAAGRRRTTGSAAVGPTGEPVRAGMLKAGVGYWRISPFERRVLAAVAAVAGATGVAVMVHLEYGSAAWEVLEALAARRNPGRQGGARARRPEPRSGPARASSRKPAPTSASTAWHDIGKRPDSAIVDCLVRVVEVGDPARLLLGGDVARRSRYRAYGGMPGLDYLPKRFLPRLRSAVGPDVVATMLVDNPARLLALHRS